MYSGVFWESVNSIGFIYCDYHSQYSVLLVYSNVRRCIREHHYSVGGVDHHALQKRRSFRLLNREVTDRSAEPNERRPVAILAALRQPREGDLVGLRELLGRQQLLRFGWTGVGVRQLGRHGR